MIQWIILHFWFLRKKFSTVCQSAITLYVTIMEIITMDKLDFKGRTFELTRDHMFEGIRKDGVGCPLALALRDFLFCDMNLEDDPNLDDLEISVD